MYMIDNNCIIENGGQRHGHLLLKCEAKCLPLSSSQLSLTNGLKSLVKSRVMLGTCFLCM